MENTYKADISEAAKEDIFYCLAMFPYPSGSGLHVGHGMNFTAVDIVARHKRMQGYTVINPIGRDSFGLPTENYAMHLGKPASEVTKDNIAFYKKQCELMDRSYDWDRELATSSPEYYKRTQWIFTKLFEHGLVYKKEAFINRCTGCQTVLANDQVVNGVCERCSSEVVQKKHPQRFIKITDYAERLIQDLDTVEWPEDTKLQQKYWIGKSEGSEITFEIAGESFGEINQTFPELLSVIKAAPSITVFTTRPDTLMGVTALVLAPEITAFDAYVPEDNQKEIEEYRLMTSRKTAVERQQDADSKTGVFSGIYVLHPITAERVPVWFADYVLPDYATGAVMFVPAHDERDWAFAKKHGISCKRVIQAQNVATADVVDGDTCYTGEGNLIHSGQFDGLLNTEAKKVITQYVESVGKGRTKVTYKLRDWSVSRQRYWGSPIPVYYTFENQEKVDFIDDYSIPGGDGSEWNYNPNYPVEYRPIVHTFLHDVHTDRYLILDRGKYGLGIIGGGKEEGESVEEAGIREAREESGYKDITYRQTIGGEIHQLYYHPTKGMNYYSPTYAIVCEIDTSKEQQNIDPIEAEKHTTLWVSKEELEQSRVELAAKYFLGKLFGKELMQYRQIDRYNAYNPHPDRSQWIPHCIPEDELPVVLPLDLGNYKPAGKSPLADHPTFPYYKAKDGNIYLRECDTLDTFMCSSFYFLRFVDPHNTEAIIAKELADKALPVDFYIGGKEHIYGHLLYSRFIHKFLFDHGYVGCAEPFQTLFHQGMVLGSDGRKMSKRRGNVVTPEDLITKYGAERGADVLRTYTMFMGPLEVEKPWNDSAVDGVKRFLDRVEKMQDFVVDDHGKSRYHLSFYDLQSRNAIKSGIKTIETRALNPEEPERYFGDIKSGDMVYCVNKNTDELLPCKVEEVFHWGSFEELRADSHISDIYSDKAAFAKVVSVDDVKRSYDYIDGYVQKIEKNGLVGWRITPYDVSVQLHKTIKGVSDDIERLKFNTAISKMMIFVNYVYDVKVITIEQFKVFLQLLAPFATRLTQQLRELYGGEGNIHFSQRPSYDATKLVADTFDLPVQINGKMRGNISIPLGSTQDFVENAVKNSEKFKIHFEGNTVKKTIFVPDKIINFIVG